VTYVSIPEKSASKGCKFNLVLAVCIVKSGNSGEAVKCKVQSARDRQRKFIRK